MDDADEELTRLAISQALEIDHQNTEIVPGWDRDRVEQVRRLGRAIGRSRGWRIHTAAVERDDDRVTALVVVMTGDPDDEERIRQRSDLLLREAFGDATGET